MKKIIAGVLAVSALLSASNMALAAGSGVNIDDIYYGTTNTVKTATNGYTTVIIKKIAELDKIIVNARGEISNEKDPAKVLLLEDKYLKEFNNKKDALEKIEKYTYYSIVNTYKNVFKVRNN